ncbi:MAG: hypothetical protein F7B06_04415 [Opitutae bacterium]|nr:hypothetical protein [Opitutae bacterium]
MNVLCSLRITLLFISLSMMIPGLRAQEAVTLYLEPNTSGHVVDTLPADDPRLEYAAEMGSNSDEPLIWKTFELNDTFEGYVEKGEVTKGLTVIPGALVYFMPEKESAFLTVLQTDNEVQVLGTENDWAKISLAASLPVYFQAEAPEEAQESLPTPAQEPESAGTELASELYSDSTSIAGDQGPYSQRSSNLTQSRPISGLLLVRKLEGRQGKISTSGLFSRVNYTWDLVDRNNRRNAFVDAKNLIPIRPLEGLEGRRVILSCTISEWEDRKDILIVARQIVSQ